MSWICEGLCCGGPTQTHILVDFNATLTVMARPVISCPTFCMETIVVFYIAGECNIKDSLSNSAHSGAVLPRHTSTHGLLQLMWGV